MLIDNDDLQWLQNSTHTLNKIWNNQNLLRLGRYHYKVIESSPNLGWQVQSSDFKWVLFNGTRKECEAFVDRYLDKGSVPISTPQGLSQIDPYLVIVQVITQS
jgi:hypothetical protein